MTGFVHWWKDIGGGVMSWIQASVANPVPVQVAGFAFDGDFVVDLDREVTTATATIANGASLSDAINVSAGRVTGLQLPAAITFQGSINGGATYGDIYDDGIERTIDSASVVAARILSLDGDDWRAFTHLKIRSGTSAAAVNQGASRSLVVAIEGGV